MDKFKFQYFPKRRVSTSEAAPLMYQPNRNAVKSSMSITCMLEKVKEYELLLYHISENRRLINSFGHLAANAA